MGAWERGARGVVELPDGRLLRGTGRRRARDDVPPPEFAVYLLGADPRVEEWESRWVRWPDFRTPRSTDDAVEALVEAHARAAAERVEIACGSGVGRTGTALAFVATLGRVPPRDAVAWVRRH